MSNGYMYEVESWQGLLQQLVYLIGRGYYHCCIVSLPEKKKGSWPRIDQKLIAKYRCDRNKFKKSRLKAKGLMNFHYIRWDSIAVILHTEGELEEDVIMDDKFEDVRITPLSIKISDLTTFRVYRYGGRWTVNLARETYQGIKAELSELANTRNKGRMIMVFERVNGYPAWAGIIHQKRQLAQYLCKAAAKNQISLSVSQLRINDRRKPVKVWITKEASLG